MTSVVFTSPKGALRSQPGPRSQKPKAVLQRRGERVARPKAVRRLQRAAVFLHPMLLHPDQRAALVRRALPIPVARALPVAVRVDFRPCWG